MIQKNILSKYCKLDKSFGRKVEIHQQYLWCGAKTAQIWKKWPQNTSFLPELDAFTIWRSVLKRVKVRREQAVGTEDVKVTAMNMYKYKERLRLYKRWPCSTYILNRVIIIMVYRWNRVREIGHPLYHMLDFLGRLILETEYLWM